MNPVNMFRAEHGSRQPTVQLRPLPNSPQDYQLCGDRLSYAVIATGTDRVIGMFPSLYWALRFTEGNLDTGVKIMEVVS